jgi:hypothetical protein
MIQNLNVQEFTGGGGMCVCFFFFFSYKQSPKSVRAKGERLYTTVSLDTVFSDLLLDDSKKTIHWLKVDVEGHEWPVFKGARHLLSKRKVNVVVVESLGWHSARSDGCTMMERLSFLFDAGYHATCLRGGDFWHNDEKLTGAKWKTKESWMGSCKSLSINKDGKPDVFFCIDMMFCRDNDCSVE